MMPHSAQLRNIAASLHTKEHNLPAAGFQLDRRLHEWILIGVLHLTRYNRLIQTRKI
jgi:hypothetical protein